MNRFVSLLAQGSYALHMGLLRWPVAVLFVYSTVFGCALWTQLLAWRNPTRPKWPRAEDFFVGYCLLTALCLCSLVLAHSFTPGVLVADLLSLMATWSWIRRKPRRPRLGATLPEIAVKLAFVGMIVAIYFPLLSRQSLRYRLPDIFDLPKQLSALAAVAHATQWPLPNPYFPEAPFAYNPGVYVAPGIICQSLPWVELIPIIMAVTIVLVVWHTLGLMQRLMLRLSIPRKFHFGGLLLATFLGNLTPLLVSRTPPIAFTLCLENLSPRWIDDPYTSFIYIPQHILAVGCILSAWLFHTSRLSPAARLASQELLLGSAALSSLILAPLALAALAVLFGTELVRCFRGADGPARVRSLTWIGIVSLAFVTLVGPFLFQVRNWAGSYGRPSLAMPNMTWKNWAYLVVSTGIVLPLAIIPVFRLPRQGTRVRRYYDSYGALLLVGLLFFLFVLFPDSWLKLGLFLRLSVVPVAALGLYVLWIAAGKIPMKLGRLLLVSILVAHVAVSFRVMRPLIASAYIRRDHDEAALIKVLRKTPADQSILLATPSQEICALVGRPLYMDFKPVRADRYLPASDRANAEGFFGQIRQQLPRMYDRGIGIILTAADSPEAISCKELFGHAEFATSQWMVFHTKHVEDAAILEGGHAQPIARPPFPSSLLVAFILKTALVLCVTGVNRRFCHSILEAIVGSWISVQLGLTALMGLLSVPRVLTGTALWVSLVIAIAFGLYALRWRRSAPQAGPSGAEAARLWASPVNVIAAVGIAVLFAGLAYRSLYFFDTTWDGLVYELPRVSFYAERQSILMHESSGAINLFCNEWNGELNSLLYVLLTGNDQASGFGSVEIWLFAVLALTWLAGLLGIPCGWRLMAALLAASTPLVLGLAMVVKGDLLACAAFVAALCWIIRLGTTNRGGWEAFQALSAIGLATGSKIVTLPVGVGLTAVVLFLISRGGSKFGCKSALAIGFVALLIGNLRYVLNALQYGNPFMRLTGESSASMMTNVPRNIIGLSQGAFECLYQWPFQGSKEFWALSAGLGYLGLWIVVFAPLAWLVKRRSDGTRRINHIVGNPWASRLIAIVLVLSAAHLLLSIHWYPWAFRYFAPWLLVVLLVCLRIVFIRVSGPMGAVVAGCCLVVVAANAAIASRTGEVRPGPFAVAKNRTQLERKLAFHRRLYDDLIEADHRLVETLATPCTKVLLCQRPDEAVYPFFGQNHCAHVQFTGNLTTLLSLTSSNEYDLVVIAGKPTQEDERPTLDELHQLGYATCVSQSRWRILAPTTDTSATSATDSLGGHPQR